MVKAAKNVPDFQRQKAGYMPEVKAKQVAACRDKQNSRENTDSQLHSATHATSLITSHYLSID